MKSKDMKYTEAVERAFDGAKGKKHWKGLSREQLSVLGVRHGDHVERVNDLFNSLNPKKAEVAE